MAADLDRKVGERLDLLDFEQETSDPVRFLLDVVHMSNIYSSVEVVNRVIHNRWAA